MVSLTILSSVLFLISGTIIAKGPCGWILPPATGPAYFSSLDMERLLDAIRTVESSNRICVPDGDNGRAVGPYQIHRNYWTDGTRFLGVSWPYSDARNPMKSRVVVKAYLKHYGRFKTVEELAAIHCSGPRGYLKLRTSRKVQNYVAKVKREFEKNRHGANQCENDPRGGLSTAYSI